MRVEASPPPQPLVGRESLRVQPVADDRHRLRLLLQGLLVVGHDLTNIEHGHGGPSDPAVLNSPDRIVAELDEAFTVTMAEVVDREVETDDGPRVAKDTLVLAQRASA